MPLFIATKNRTETDNTINTAGSRKLVFFSKSHLIQDSRAIEGRDLLNDVCNMNVGVRNGRGRYGGNLTIDSWFKEGKNTAFGETIIWESVL